MHTPKIMLIPDYIEEIDKMKKQQQEFIKYLEDKKDFYKINMQGFSMSLIEEILQKYKEIIGKDINVGTKGGKDE